MSQARVERVPDVHKIAVLRTNALGDFIFTLPTLEALRTAYPSAEIVLLAKAWHAAFLTERPSPIDRVVVIPPYGGVSEIPDIEENPLELNASTPNLRNHPCKTSLKPDARLPDAEAHSAISRWKHIEYFFNSMHREHFDLAFQLHRGGRYSNPFTQQLGARMTIGLKTSDAVPLDRWIPYIYLQHEVLRYLEVVSLVGATTTLLEPRISVTKKDILEANRSVPEGDNLLVALHPGASEPGRRWAVESLLLLEMR